VSSADTYIAVVDDEGPVRTMLRRVLSLADYKVATFESGEAFLSSLGSMVPSCIILDVHMPHLSGLDVQSRLLAAHRHIPVVFITASADPALEDVVLQAEGVTLLRKPFCTRELLDAVSGALLQRMAPPDDR
jgi:FixJ family two-component response regulator